MVLGDDLGVGRVVGRLNREGTEAYIRLSRTVLRLKRTQHCKAISIQLN